MIIHKIVDSDILTYLEKSYYELQMKQEIIIRIIELSINNPQLCESPLFQKYEQDYQEVYITYEFYKNQFTDFLRQNLIDNNELYNDIFTWEIESFYLNTVRIQFNDK